MRIEELVPVSLPILGEFSKLQDGMEELRRAAGISMRAAVSASLIAAIRQYKASRLVR